MITERLPHTEVRQIAPNAFELCIGKQVMVFQGIWTQLSPFECQTCVRIMLLSFAQVLDGEESEGVK